MLNLIGKHSLIQPDDPLVAQLAERLRAPKRAFEWVKSNIKYRPQLRTDWWQPPSETLKLMEGDCEDQAILLSSIFEAMGIPSRLGYGLTHGGFHVWSEAHGKVLDPAMEKEFEVGRLFDEGYLPIVYIYPWGELPALPDSLFMLLSSLIR